MYINKLTKKYQNGVSLFEFILVFGIILAATPIVVYQINLYNKRQAGQLYAQNTIMYAKAFSRYIHDMSSSATQITDVQCKDLFFVPRKNYLPIGMDMISACDPSKNTKYGVPKVAYDPSKQSYVMYYVRDNSTAQQKVDDAKNSLSGHEIAMSIGAAAGVYSKLTGGGVYQVDGIGNNWHFKTTDTTILNNDKNNIPENSVVINLAMLPANATLMTNNNVSPSPHLANNTRNNLSENDLNNKASNDVVNGPSLGASNDKYLYRVKDTDAEAGSINNSNTMQADITIANKDKDPKSSKIIYHGIKFTPDQNGPILKYSGNGDQIVLQNGVLKAGSFTATQTRDLGDSCPSSELGTVLLANPIQYQTGQTLLICRKANSNYRSCSYGYCYAPIGVLKASWSASNQSTYTCSNEIYKYVDKSPTNTFEYPDDSTVRSIVDIPLSKVTCSFEPAV